MHAPVRANPIHDAPGADDERRRPTVLYVDFAKLESRVGRDDVSHLSSHDTPPRRTAPRRVTTVGDEVRQLRRNVQDAARAVLTWLAGVTQHDGDSDLHEVLDRCLRPGPDAGEVNYAALTLEINQALGLDLSAKRVQTAVRHLRDMTAGQSASKQRSQATAKSATLTERIDTLYAQLRINHDSLITLHGAEGHVLRRAVAHDVLGVLRSAAGRLIECGFGEGIPQHIDLDATRQRFLGFVRRITSQGTDPQHTGTLGQDIDRLLKALRTHDDSAEADMQLVTAGVCVVSDLAGPASLAGLMAKLNLLMVGRPMLESEFFVSQMLSLADAAGGLIHDRATKTDLAWVRLQPQDRQIPSPNRVRSYCLNNAATHILQRLHTGELAGAHWFAAAQQCFDTMQQHDRGFRLLKVTEAIMLCVLADLTRNVEPARAFFEKLGADRSLVLIRDLARFDNSVELNRLVRRHADKAHEGVASELLVLPI